MPLSSLGYLGIQSSKLEDWSQLATQLLGMQQVDRGASIRAYRMDDRKQRLVVDGGGDAGIKFMGWEVEEKTDLESLAASLQAAGVAVSQGTRALADERHVAELIHFQDPGANRVEVFWKPELASDPFVPGRPISGFRTGALGMGHVVLNVENVELLIGFYRDLLGFRVSDYGLTPYPLYFFHINGRHHSFAIVGSGRRALHHLMVEVGSLDDLGQGYDLAQLEQDRIAYTLGRHTNDHMTSFYVNTPSGFFIEYGWGGRVIDPATWKPHETFDGPSLWGHDRLYAMPEQQRQRLREMRLDAAARGVRVPDPTLPSLVCPWLDSVASQRSPTAAAH